MHHPSDRIAHTTAFCYTSRGVLAGTTQYWIQLIQMRFYRFYIFRQTVQIATKFLHLKCAHISFFLGLILRDIPNSITPQTTLRLLPIPVGLLILPCTRQYRRPPPPPPPYSLSLFSPVPDRGTGEGRYLCP